MNQTFGAQALDLCGVAARVLGWRPRDFWGATPAELASCLGIGGPVAGGAAGLLDRSALERIFGQRFGDEAQ